MLVDAAGWCGSSSSDRRPIRVDLVAYSLAPPKLGVSTFAPRVLPSR
jgi:hypothetical protein